MKIHYSIVAGIALMIGFVVSGCKQDNKVSFIQPPNTDSLQVLKQLKIQYPEIYDLLMKEKDQRISNHGLIKQIWSKEIKTGIHLKFYLIAMRGFGHVYVLEKGKEKFVIEPKRFYIRPGGDVDHTTYNDILTGTSFEGLLPEVLIRDNFIANKLSVPDCGFQGPHELFISPNYFLNQRDIVIIKDTNDLKKYENCLRDTTINLPTNWPDTTEALGTERQWVDTFTQIEKLNIRAKAVATQQKTNREFQTNIRYAIRRARMEGLQILPEIKKNYNNLDYIYYYQPSDLAVYEIRLQRKKPRSYTVKTLVPSYQSSYHFSI
jgi:hypothetical protein